MQVLFNLDLKFEENVLGYDYAAAKQLAGVASVAASSDSASMASRAGT